MNIAHFQVFWDIIFCLKDFSRPGNNHVQIPRHFQVFHDLPEPPTLKASSGCQHTLTPGERSRSVKLPLPSRSHTLRSEEKVVFKLTKRIPKQTVKLK